MTNATFVLIDNYLDAAADEADLRERCELLQDYIGIRRSAKWHGLEGRAQAETDEQARSADAKALALAKV